MFFGKTGADEFPSTQYAGVTAAHWGAGHIFSRDKACSCEKLAYICNRFTVIPKRIFILA
jgi:hypothetical protein